MNVIEGTVQRISSADGMCEVEINTELGVFYSVVLESPGEAEFIKEGRRVRCIFKGTDAEILRERVHTINVFEGKVKDLLKGPVISMLSLDCGGKVLRFMLTNKQLSILSLSEGDRVYVVISPMRVVLEVSNG